VLPTPKHANAPCIGTMPAWHCSGRWRRRQRCFPTRTARRRPSTRQIAGSPTHDPGHRCHRATGGDAIIANAILSIADTIKEAGWRPEFGGVFHATNSGEMSWYSFATAIFQEVATHGYKPPQVQPIAIADWPTPIRRPPDSRLNCSKLKQVFDVSLPSWSDSLPTVVRDILKNFD
jgi:hypothetical protein